MTPGWIGFWCGVIIGGAAFTSILCLAIIAQQSDERLKEIMKRAKQ